MASTSRRREAVLFWAIEALEGRRLLHHQIDSYFVPNTTEPDGGHWVALPGAQVDQEATPDNDPPPIGFVRRFCGEEVIWVCWRCAGTCPTCDLTFVWSSSSASPSWAASPRPPRYRR